MRHDYPTDDNGYHIVIGPILETDRIEDRASIAGMILQLIVLIACVAFVAVTLTLAIGA